MGEVNTVKKLSEKLEQEMYDVKGYRLAYEDEEGRSEITAMKLDPVSKQLVFTGYASGDAEADEEELDELDTEGMG
jgi:hypothetical protein